MVKQQKGLKFQCITSPKGELDKDTSPEYEDPRTTHHYPSGIKHEIFQQCLLLAASIGDEFRESEV